MFYGNDLHRSTGSTIVIDMTTDTTSTRTPLTWLTSSRGHLVSAAGHVIQHVCPGNVDHDPRVLLHDTDLAVTEYPNRAAAVEAVEAAR